MEGALTFSDDHHFRREDRTIHWLRISTHIAAHPDDLRIALENIARWMELGRVHPGPLIEWRERVHDAQDSEAAYEELISFLAAPNHDSERIKSCSPFVGLPIHSNAE